MRGKIKTTLSKLAGERSQRLQWRQMKDKYPFPLLVAVSVESTGPRPERDHVFDLAAVKVEHGIITDVLAQPIKSAGKLSSVLFEWAGLTESLCNMAVEPAELKRDLKAFIPPDAVIAIHGAVTAVLAESFLPEQNAANLIETESLARFCMPAVGEYSLDELSRSCALEQPAGRRVISDAVRTVRLLPHLCRAAADLPYTVLMNALHLLGAQSWNPLVRLLEDAAREWKLAHPGLEPGGLRALTSSVEQIQPRAPRDEDAAICPLDINAMLSIFSPGGAFTKAFAGYEHREEQLCMTRAVAQAFNQGKHLLVEAGTGVGKSLAYILPSATWSAQNQMPVILSTNTRNLQAQLFEKDIPCLSAALGRKISAALIKGRGNYLCLRKFFYLLEHADVEMTAEECQVLLPVLAWAFSTATGDLVESGVWESRTGAGLTAKLTSSGDDCRGGGCPHRRNCFLYRARRKAAAADVVVANHAVVFGEMGLDKPVLPPYRHIVFDEAHNLEEVATGFFSVEISAARSRMLLGRLWRRRGRQRATGLLPALLHTLQSGRAKVREDWLAAVVRLAEEAVAAIGKVPVDLDDFLKSLGKLLPDDPEAAACSRFCLEEKQETQWRPIVRHKEKLVAGLALVMKALEALVERLQEEALGVGSVYHDTYAADIIAQVARLREWIVDLDFVVRADDKDYVFWVERVPDWMGGYRAWAAPIDVGPRLAEELYSQKDSVIFCSATLTVGGSTEFIRRRLGINRLPPEQILEECVGTPFDYQKQCRVLVPVFLPLPNAPDCDYSSALAELMAETFRISRGRALALFTSYAMLRRSAEILEERLRGEGFPVLAQGISGSRELITGVFTRDVHSILLGTDSFWEGVDVAGESLSCLVVGRLPFAVFTDPVMSARCEQIEAEGSSAFSGFSLPGAVIRFRQGFGRLIRHRNDRGIVIVADRRIVSKRYGKWFQKSLPAEVCAITTREAFLEEIRSFFATQ